MDIKLFWSDKIKFGSGKREQFQDFAQKMANRLGFGEVRYGPPDSRQKYMTRLGMEYKAYKRTGNAEHLYNIANYCLLEHITPEHKHHHEDTKVDSVTRRRM